MEEQLINQATRITLQWINHKGYQKQLNGLSVIEIKKWVWEKMQPIENIDSFTKGAKIVNWDQVKSGIELAS